MKFRKRPVVIEAMQISEFPDETQTFPQWFFKAIVDGQLSQSTSGNIQVHTLEGVMQANPGDWIIQGVKGELYPCKDEIFKLTYEPVTE